MALEAPSKRTEPLVARRKAKEGPHDSRPSTILDNFSIKDHTAPQRLTQTNTNQTLQSPIDHDSDQLKYQVTSAKSALIWDRYMKMAGPKDKATLDEWEGFILVGLQDLRSDPAKATVTTVRQLTVAVRMEPHPSTGESEPRSGLALPGTPSQASTMSLWANYLWHTSLVLSIFASFFAMLAKVWCYKTRIKYKGTQFDRVVERQRTWAAVERWKMETFIVQLPIVMHTAVILFILGLVLYLSEIHQVTMMVTTIPVVVTILLYLFFTVTPMVAPSCPLDTPFTLLFRAGTSWLLSIFRSPLDAAKSIIRCFKSIAQSASLALLCVIFPASRSVPISELDEYGPKPQDILDNRISFQALLWLLRHSNDKTIVAGVLEHISSFPEVILLSETFGSELHNAAAILCSHIRRIRHDTIEWYDLNDENFILGCYGFIHLATRPWLHSRLENVEEIKKMAECHLPFSRDEQEELSLAQLNSQLTALNDRKKRGGQKQNSNRQKKRSTKSAIVVPVDLPWLERSAICIALDTFPMHGLRMCKELWQFISSNGAPKTPYDHHSCLAIWWIFLNCVLDCRSEVNGGNSYFWPSGMPASEIRDIGVDGTLTLIHFRHADTRKSHNVWLTLVGISSMLHACVHPKFHQHDASPFKKENREYFFSLTKVLQDTLDLPLPQKYDHDLPVYNRTRASTGTLPHKINALQYGQEAISSIIKLLPPDNDAAPQLGDSEESNDPATGGSVVKPPPPKEEKPFRTEVLEKLEELKKAFISKFPAPRQERGQERAPARQTATAKSPDAAEKGLIHEEVGPSGSNANAHQGFA
ncbi:unnamed protein product [Rhizoctonia solani]|uniref:DUF6535 domain-containing protein n=1 Tax=Rhizoctonia solani TaxID=456999 RepID=A0A8H3H2C9_9AGAM|nr:unnamed protein product [Rhizoctonia solani]